MLAQPLCNDLFHLRTRNARAQQVEAVDVGVNEFVTHQYQRDVIGSEFDRKVGRGSDRIRVRAFLGLVLMGWQQQDFPADSPDFYGEAFERLGHISKHNSRALNDAGGPH